jgi:hypothetical protein
MAARIMAALCGFHAAAVAAAETGCRIVADALDSFIHNVAIRMADAVMQRL